jgi:nucleoid-associated protein YgaU
LTREHKLALIIGFTLVLVVGVLISDHMSRASRVQLDGSEDRGAIALTPTSGVPAAPPLRPPSAALGEWAANQRVGGTAEQDVTAEAFGRPVDQPLAARAPADAPAAPNGIVDTARGAIDATIAGATEVIHQGRRLGERLADAEVPAALALRPGNTTSASVASAERYTVQPGDTLFRIAERFYGSGHAWRALATANDGRVAANGTVRVGVALTLPRALDGRALDARTLEGRGTAASGLDDAPRRSPGAETPSGATTYTVQRGDTLGEIAVRELGTVRRMQEILDLNDDKLDDADDIRVGMKLRLPTR